MEEANLEGRNDGYPKKGTIDMSKLETANELEDLFKKHCATKPIFLLFWAPWDAASAELKSRMEDMSKVYKNSRFVYVDF